MQIKDSKAFSLVELMIVVGIIGILATLALPRFKQFQAKAKMGEAKNILMHIFTLEQSYSIANNAFVAFPPIGASVTSIDQLNCATPSPGAEALGFKIDPCPAGEIGPVPRFSYRAQARVNIRSDFMATATTGAALNNKVCPGNTAHAWGVDETKILAQVRNATARVFSNVAAPAEPVVGTVCPR